MNPGLDAYMCFDNVDSCHKCINVMCSAQNNSENTILNTSNNRIDECTQSLWLLLILVRHLTMWVFILSKLTSFPAPNIVETFPYSLVYLHGINDCGDIPLGYLDES